MSGPRVLTFANQKGGVGKTTTVACLGAALAEAGRRVLLVDLDPQACLTFSVGLDPDAIEVSLYEVMLGLVDPRAVVVGHRGRAGPAAGVDRPGRVRGAAAACAGP